MRALKLPVPEVLYLILCPSISKFNSLFAPQFFDQDSLNYRLDLLFNSFDNDDSGALKAPFHFDWRNS